jgi:hypothetical protein
MDKNKFEWLSDRNANGAAEYLEAMQQRVVMLKLYQHYCLIAPLVYYKAKGLRSPFLAVLNSGLGDCIASKTD